MKHNFKNAVYGSRHGKLTSPFLSSNSFILFSAQSSSPCFVCNFCLYSTTLPFRDLIRSSFYNKADCKLFGNYPWANLHIQSNLLGKHLEEHIKLEYFLSEVPTISILVEKYSVYKLETE